MYHTEPLSAIHTGGEIKRHTGKIREFASVTGAKMHPGCKTSNHSGKPNHKYHPGKKQYSSVQRTGAFIVTLSISYWMTEKEDWEWYDCCNTYTKKAGKGCANMWTCCGEVEGNTECKLGANKVWDCCGALWGDKGCEDVTKDKKLWSCCRQKTDSEGCEKVYACCNRSGKGCYEYYPCCNQRSDAEPCTEKCVNCKENWGTGEGCVQTN